ncbi:MAG: hypothetical protein E7326_07360 [Clostridiales bacterium]|nr:hypothetical protein [Clostridiales bacterium]
MKETDLKRAFGSTPECMEQCVVRALRLADRRENQVKHSVTKLILVTALIVVLLGAAAFAAGELGVLQLLSIGQEINEDAAAGVQAVEGEYSGNAVRMTLNDALYDDNMGTFAISWVMENLHDDENLYVLFDGVTFGGAWAEIGNGRNQTEFLLPADETMGSMLGKLPGNDSTDGEIRFAILRALAPMERIAETETLEAYRSEIARVQEKGSIPCEGDGVPVVAEYDLDKTPAENLLATGQFEMADQFSVSFTLQTGLLDDTYRAYEGEKQFVFDDYELRIREAYMTATGAYFEVEYITPEAPVDMGKGMGWPWKVRFTDPDGGFWFGNAGGSYEDPVPTEDGRYMSVYAFEVVQVFYQPEKLQMTLVTYDETFNSTVHEEDAVLLHF